MHSVYFKVLELPNGSTKSQVKKAYRNLAKKYHPDVSKLPNSRDKFIEISQAYEKLMDRFDRPLEYTIYTQKQRKKAYRKRAANRASKKGSPGERAKNYASMEYDHFKSAEAQEFPFPILKFLLQTIAFILILVPIFYFVVWPILVVVFELLVY